MNITIASGKGGTGKTTLSVNLATFLAETSEKKVILADLDVEEPNSGIFINGEKGYFSETFVPVPEWDSEKCTFCGKCGTLCNFNAILSLPATVMVFQELCHNCFACSELCPSGALPMVMKPIGTVTLFNKKSLLFVEGRLYIGVEKSVPLIREVKRYVHSISDENDLKIFDAPPGTSCPVIEAVRDTDYVILITEPTPFGLHDLKLAAGMVRKMGKPFGVVINRYGNGDISVESWLEDEGIPLLGTISNNRVIAEDYSRGELIYPKSEIFRNELKNIIDSVSRYSGRRIG